VGEINNRAAEPHGCCSQKVFVFGFNTLMTAAEPRGIKPSTRIKTYPKDKSVELKEEVLLKI
jgi:hypothetical protein